MNINLNDDKFISVSVDALKEQPIKVMIDHSPHLVLFASMYASCIAAALFGEDEEDDSEPFMNPPFETICECECDDIRYEIVYGGIYGDNYEFTVKVLPEGRTIYKHVFDNMSDAYKALISRLL